VLFLLDVHIFKILSEELFYFAYSLLKLSQFNSSLLVEFKGLGVALLHRGSVSRLFTQQIKEARLVPIFDPAITVVQR